MNAAPHIAALWLWRLGPFGRVRRVVSGYTAPSFIRRYATDLAGACLARHFHRFVEDAGAIGRASPMIDHSEHRAADSVEVAFRNIQSRAAALFRLASVDGFDQARFNRTASGNPRRHHSQLKRRGKHITLPDGGVDGVPDPPIFAARLQLPSPIWREAIFDSRQRQIMADTKPKLARHFCNFVDHHLLADVVKVDIARLFERFVHIHMPVSATLPTMEPLSGHGQMSRTPNCAFWCYHTCFKGR